MVGGVHKGRDLPVVYVSVDYAIDECIVVMVQKCLIIYVDMFFFIFCAFVDEICNET